MVFHCSRAFGGLTFVAGGLQRQRGGLHICRATVSNPVIYDGGPHAHGESRGCPVFAFLLVVYTGINPRS